MHSKKKKTIKNTQQHQHYGSLLAHKPMLFGKQIGVPFDKTSILNAGFLHGMLVSPSRLCTCLTSHFQVGVSETYIKKTDMSTLVDHKATCTLIHSCYIWKLIFLKMLSQVYTFENAVFEVVVWNVKTDDACLVMRHLLYRSISMFIQVCACYGLFTFTVLLSNFVHSSFYIPVKMTENVWVQLHFRPYLKWRLSMTWTRQ